MKLNFGRRLVLFVHWLLSLAACALGVALFVWPECRATAVALLQKTDVFIYAIAVLVVYLIFAVGALCIIFGGRKHKEKNSFIAVATSELMKQYDVAIWAHHGMFCSGEDFDLTFGLMHTVEKSAEILVKVRSMQDYKRQTITPDDFRHLAKDFGVKLPEKFLFEK